MPSVAVENYLKHIYIAAEKATDGVVGMGVIAKKLDVTPGTATSMVKTLDRDGLVRYEPRLGATLTADGKKAALQVLRRHRLIEYFLAETLKMDWSEVHAEAERLEHAVSDRLLERLDTYLGHPQFDPHGDAIPTAEGRMVERKLLRLSAVGMGELGTVARISDQDIGFLKFARNRGMVPGQAVTLVRKDADADCIEITIDGSEPVILGMAAADKIWIEIA